MTEQGPGTEPANDGKLIAILSYITIVGWIISLLLHSNNRTKSKLATVHLRQSLGLYLLGLVVSIIQSVIVVIPFIGWIAGIGLAIIYPVLFIFWIIGLIRAISGDATVLPAIGEPIQDLLRDIIK
ncbi:MAG: hypothetical protein WD355_04370 [Balneolaceae bacterium]